MSLRRPPRVGFEVVPPLSDADVTTLYLMHLPDGVPMMLTGSAALIWVLASEGEQDVAGALAGLLGEERSAIADEVDAYLRLLVAQGWLEGDA